MRIPHLVVGSLLGIVTTMGAACGDKDSGGTGTTVDGGATADAGATGDGGSTTFVDNDFDGVSPDDGDCDDSNPEIFPGQEEACDGIDQNCNGVIDEGFTDTDGDGTADCVDTEECDGVDNNGDGVIDEGFDIDGDGVPDCDVAEICDGIDNNGDGNVDEGFDGDGDGYTSCGTDDVAADCDDTDAAVNPGATEVAGDLIDNDCDGMVDEDDWAAGDLFITEIMNNPYQVPDPDGEWFEVYNDAGRDLIVNGLVITSTVDSDWHQVVSDDLIWIAPGEHFVFGISDDITVNGNLLVGYQYADVSLSNEDDDLVLMMGDVVVDQVSWDDGATMPDPQGATISLDPTAYGEILNDSSASWCQASFAWDTNTDYGSPNNENEFCWPVAEASYYTDTAEVYTCSAIYLVGSDSYDPDGATLAFEWELVSAPASSALGSSDIAETTDADPVFVPDEPGTYQFALTTYNGTEYSSPVYLTVEVLERPFNADPDADAGPDQTYSEDVACTPVSYGVYYTCDACNDAEFSLDGSDSYDLDDDEITDYLWEITGGTGSGVIDDPTAAATTVTMTGPSTTYGDTDTETLELTLTVTDCMGATGDDQMSISYQCSGT